MYIYINIYIYIYKYYFYTYVYIFTYKFSHFWDRDTLQRPATTLQRAATTRNGHNLFHTRIHKQTHTQPHIFFVCICIHLHTYVVYTLSCNILLTHIYLHITYVCAYAH